MPNWQQANEITITEFPNINMISDMRLFINSGIQVNMDKRDPWLCFNHFLSTKQIMYSLSRKKLCGRSVPMAMRMWCPYARANKYVSKSTVKRWWVDFDLGWVRDDNCCNHRPHCRQVTEQLSLSGSFHSHQLIYDAELWCFLWFVAE